MNENNPNATLGQPALSDTELKASLMDALGTVANYLDAKERATKMKIRVGLVVVGLMALSSMVSTGQEMWAAAHAPPRVVVIPVEGEISAGGPNGADRLVPLVSGACKDAAVKGVVLRINSPGGSAGESERVSAALAGCRVPGHSKPVLAVVDGVGASAAYLLAIQADEVIANRYAMVGSIGAVMHQVNAAELMERVGISETVYASGPMKAWGSSIRPDTKDQAAMLQSVVDSAAAEFQTEVRERRGKKLVPSPDMFTGRVWLAPEAKRLGLIDEVGVVDQVLEQRFPNVPVDVVRPKPSLGQQLGLVAMAADVLREATASPRWQ